MRQSTCSPFDAGIQPHGEKLLFRFYAPNAERVSVVGDFNGWDPDCAQMQKNEDGIWEVEIDRSLIKENQNYKFYLCRNGEHFYRADPFARRTQVCPDTASVIPCFSEHAWQDASWLRYRKEAFSEGSALSRPVNIYRVNLATWQKDKNQAPLSYEALATELSTYVKQMGYTHIELFPLFSVTPNETGEILGSCFAPASELGSAQELCAFVDKMHGAGIGVIFDLLPGAFEEDTSGAYRFSNAPIGEGDKPMLVAQIEFLASVYHADGIFLLPEALAALTEIQTADLLSSLQEAILEQFPDLLLGMGGRGGAMPLKALAERRLSESPATYEALISLEERLHGEASHNIPLYKSYLLALLTLPSKKRTLMGREFEGLTHHDKPEGEAPLWSLLEQDMHADLQRFTAALNHAYLKERVFWELDAEPSATRPISHLLPDGVCGYLRRDAEGKTRILLFNTTEELQRFSLPLPAGVHSVFCTAEADIAENPLPLAEDGELPIVLSPFGAMILGKDHTPA